MSRQSPLLAEPSGLLATTKLGDSFLREILAAVPVVAAALVAARAVVM
jgi:hypothetical protein